MLRCGEVLNSRKKNCSVNFFFLPPFFRFDSSFFLLCFTFHRAVFAVSLCLTLRISDSLFSSPVQHSSVPAAYIAPFRGTSTHMCIFSEVFLTLRLSCCLLLVDRRPQVDDDDDFLSLSAPRSSNNSSQ